jgi:hypothetical protein
MKNPFQKEDNSGIIIAAGIAALAAGALAYLFLTESGSKTRKSIKHRLSAEVKDMAASAVSKKTGIKKKTLKKAADQVG